MLSGLRPPSPVLVDNSHRIHARKHEAISLFS